MRTKASEHLCPNFAGFFPYFQTNFRIFDKSKLLGVRLYPPAPPPHTPLLKLASRSSIETPPLLFMVLNTGTQQTRSKLAKSACSIPVKNPKTAKQRLYFKRQMPATIYNFFMHVNVDSTAVSAPSSSTILGDWCVVTSNEKATKM